MTETQRIIARTSQQEREILRAMGIVLPRSLPKPEPIQCYQLTPRDRDVKPPKAMPRPRRRVMAQKPVRSNRSESWKSMAEAAKWLRVGGRTLRDAINERRPLKGRMLWIVRETEKAA